MTDPILHPFDRRPGATLVCSAPRMATISEVDAHTRSVARLPGARRLPPGAILSLYASNGPGFLAALIALRPVLFAPGGGAGGAG